MGQNDLVKTLRMNYLFDFYQSLLTNKQRNYDEMKQHLSNPEQIQRYIQQLEDLE